MIRVLLVFALLPAFAGGVQADPIVTPLITSLLVAADIGLSGAALSVTAGILSAVVTSAIGLGLSLLFTPRPKTPAPENGAIVVQQSLPYRIYGYGTSRIAGALVFKEQENGVLGYIAVLNGHKVSGFRAFYLNDDRVTIPSSGGLFNGTVATGEAGRYGGTIKIDTRRGEAPETAYSLITTSFSDVWTANHRGDGCASLAMTCASVSSQYFSLYYPYGAPQPSAVVDQALCFDPRDGTQSLADPATWKFTTNPIIALIHFECHSDYGPKRDYARAIAPVLSQWIQEANICDELVPKRTGGTEKRFTINGWITTEQERRTAVQSILQTCDGWICERGDGTIWPWVGKYRAPTVWLTDDDILGLQMQRGIPSDERVNRLTAKFTSPDADYTTLETAPMIDSADQVARSGPPRSAQLDLPWVHSIGQASRLQKREYLKQQQAISGKLTLRLSGVNACYERWIGIQSNSIPLLANAIVENRKPEIMLMGARCELSFVQSGPQIEVYDATTDESPPPYIPQRPPSSGVPAPANVSVVATQTNDTTGGATVSLSVSWDAAINNGAVWFATYIIQYRINGSTSASDWVKTTVSTYTVNAGRITASTGIVPADASLEVQVTTAAGVASSSQVVSTGLSFTAPGSPTLLTATGGSGSASLSCKAPNSSNHAYIQFYRAAHGASFASAVAVGGHVNGAPNSTATFVDTVAAGTYDYFATASNSSSNASSPAGPAVATVT